MFTWIPIHREAIHRILEHRQNEGELIEPERALGQQWNQITSQAAQTGQTVSRLENLIARGMVRLDSGPKRLLDAIKVVARNEFYRALAPFRKAYDNYRDDREHFRRLTNLRAPPHPLSTLY